MAALTHQGVRLGFVLTLAGTCLTFAVFTLGAIGLQRDAIEKDAQAEAIHVAQSVALGIARRPAGESMQAWLENAAPLHRQNIVIVDRQGRIAFDSKPDEVGHTYQGDAAEEFEHTLEDGQARVFIAASQAGRASGHEVAAAIRENGKPTGAIVGAVALDYSDVRDDLLRQNAWRLGFVCAIGLFCMLLTCVPGLHVHSTFGQMAEQIRASREELLVQMELERGAAQRAEHLAFHDALTGLPNRGLFSRVLNLSLEQVRREGGKLAVMFIDLDRFKNINDTLGHEAGDVLLVEVARRLGEALRTDDRVARLGGDEFVILVTDFGDQESLDTVARKIITAVARPYQIANQDVRVTASVGVSVYPVDGLDEPSLMKHADIAMYRAKDVGKNTFAFYSPELNTHSLERLGLESSLRRALEAQQFQVHYQPKVHCHSGEMTGVEALLRWNHPELGSVSPAQFIPVAEESGLIVAIGRWVLASACRQHVAWLEMGHSPLRVAVNLSARQFYDDGLLSDVRAILAQTGMDPRFLELEITESMLMRSVDKASQVLAAFKELGIRLSLDDFGTGYSSLSNLRLFPIDTIKIDRSFVCELPANEKDGAITEAVIAMGKSLDMTVVAEGVETAAQIAFLRDRECDECQGFYFSKAVPSAAIARLLEARPWAELHERVSS
jgi:diguanylate cyclase (GGDEF)-like protein